jgi:hypothetical protein
VYAVGMINITVEIDPTALATYVAERFETDPDTTTADGMAAVLDSLSDTFTDVDATVTTLDGSRLTAIIDYRVDVRAFDQHCEFMGYYKGEDAIYPGLRDRAAILCSRFMTVGWFVTNISAR